MARPRDEKKVDAIFEATLSLVQKSGFNGLKMADVARAAGMATGTLYIYFRNKEILINELFLSLKTSKTSRMLAVYHQEDSFEESFRKLWWKYLELSLEEPERMMFIEQFAHTTYLTPRTRKQSDLLLEPLAVFLQGGMTQKIIRKAPVELLLSQLMGPIYEVVKLHHEGTFRLTPAHQKTLFDMAWKSMQL